MRGEHHRNHHRISRGRRGGMRLAGAAVVAVVALAVCALAAACCVADAGQFGGMKDSFELADERFKNAFPLKIASKLASLKDMKQEGTLHNT